MYPLRGFSEVDSFDDTTNGFFVTGGIPWRGVLHRRAAMISQQGFVVLHIHIHEALLTVQALDFSMESSKHQSGKDIGFLA